MHTDNTHKWKGTSSCSRTLLKLKISGFCFSHPGFVWLLLRSYTFDSICKIAFGLEIDSLSKPLAFGRACCLAYYPSCPYLVCPLHTHTSALCPSSLRHCHSPQPAHLSVAHWEHVVPSPLSLLAPIHVPLVALCIHSLHLSIKNTLFS